MRTLIYGAGAVGSYIGGHLAIADHDVTLLGREALVNAVRSAGLTVRSADKTLHTDAIRAVTDLKEAFHSVGGFDWIAFTMKAYDTMPAIRELREVIENPIPIVSFQNGIGNEEALREVFGTEYIVAGTMTTPVSMPTPGVVIEEKRRGLAIASDSPAADLIRTGLQRTQLIVEIVEDSQTLKWSKLLLNIVGNATSAILDMPPGEVFAISQLFTIEMNAIREALAILRLKNISVCNLPGSPASLLALTIRHTPIPLLRPLLSRMVIQGRGDKLPSLLVALRAGHRRTEVAWLNGAVVQAADSMQRLAPINHALALTVSDIAAGRAAWDMYRRRPDMLLATIRAVQGCE